MHVHRERDRERETLRHFLFLQKDLNPIMGPTEDEMAGWYHQLDGHEFE